jgi:hypothetical protein
MCDIILRFSERTYGVLHFAFSDLKIKIGRFKRERHDKHGDFLLGFLGLVFLETFYKKVAGRTRLEEP